MQAVAETQMYREAREAPQRLRAHRAELEPAIGKAVALLRAAAPRFVATCARGSSDHAATYAKYLIETRLGLPTLSYAPSISSVYQVRTDSLRDAAMLFLSQSGRSPDLLAAARSAGEVGALRIGLLNDITSPMAAEMDAVLPTGAGPEISVAATKSFIGTVANILALVARWTESGELSEALARLPDQLEAAWDMDWSAAEAVVARQDRLFVLGRGLAFAVAQEAALKFKETSGIHAEALSSAEFAHGPMALARDGFTVLVFAPHDAAAEGLAAQILDLRSRGAVTIVIGEGFGGDIVLPLPEGLHPAAAPIAAIQRFYRLANAVALERGFDPDRPPFLRKVTSTL